MAVLIERDRLSNKEETSKVLLDLYQGENCTIPTIGRAKGYPKMTLSRTKIERRGCLEIVLLESELVSTPHCELFYENGRQWVKDLYSVHGTFINGTKLYPGIKLEIQPGDIISLGWSPIHVSPTLIKMDLQIRGSYQARQRTSSGQISNYFQTKYLVFKMEVGRNSQFESSQSWDNAFQLFDLAQQTVSNDIPLAPLLPREMVNKICQSLDLNDIKNCRLVSRTWNSAVLPLFISKSEVHLQCYFDNKDSAKANLQFVDEMKNFNHPNIVVYFKSGYNKPIRQYNDNLWVFTEYLKFQNLILNCDISASWGLNFLEKLLINSCLTLQNLDLIIRTFEDIPPPTTLFRDLSVLLKFKAMKKLTLELDFVPIPEFFKTIMQNLPNLVEFVIVGNNFLKSIFGLNGIIPFVSFPRTLNSISINSFLTASSVRHVIAFSHPLKRLRLETAFCLSSPGLSSAIFKLLKKHQNSLEELELRVRILTREVGEGDLKFPKFPALKSLCIWIHDDFGIQWEIDSDNFGRIDYVTHFPALEKLAVRCDTDTTYPQCFGSFFPEMQQVISMSKCEMIEFSFPPWPWLTNGNEPKYLRISTFFPYLINVVQTERIVKFMKMSVSTDPL